MIKGHTGFLSAAGRYVLGFFWIKNIQVEPIFGFYKETSQKLFIFILLRKQCNFQIYFFSDDKKRRVPPNKYKVKTKTI